MLAGAVALVLFASRLRNLLSFDALLTFEVQQIAVCLFISSVGAGDLFYVEISVVSFHVWPKSKLLSSLRDRLLRRLDLFAPI